jgi:hypothetical protein
LVFKRSTARKYEIEKKHIENCEKSNQIPVKQLEEIKRNEALSTSSLSSSNKGFNLMLKMGYKTGEGLGKVDQESLEEPKPKKVHLEPIPIVLKSDRGGLGQLTEQKRKLEEIESLRKILQQKRLDNELNTEKSYLDKKRSSFQIRKMLHSLHKCQRICFQLDSSKEV